MLCVGGQYHEGVRATWLAEDIGQGYRHPYDIGIFINLVAVSIFSFLGFLLAGFVACSLANGCLVGFLVVLRCNGNVLSFFKLVMFYHLISTAGCSFWDCTR